MLTPRLASATLPHAAMHPPEGRRNGATGQPRQMVTVAPSGRSSRDALAIAANDYPAERLSRVREQLDRLDAILLAEKNAQTLDRLASARLRPSEQERIRARRPLPGSRKPPQERAQPYRASVLPPPVLPEPALAEPIRASRPEPLL